MTARHGDLLDNLVNGLRIYSEMQFTKLDLATLIANSIARVQPTSENTRWLKGKTTLLAPRLLVQVDVEELVRRLRSQDIPVGVDRSQLEADRLERMTKEQFDIARVEALLLLGGANDKHFTAWFGFRTKEDKNIRRTRLHSIWPKIDFGFRQVMLRSGLDMITVHNICLAELIFPGWSGIYQTYDAFAGIERFIFIAKFISDSIKRGPSTFEMRMKYCENAGFTGYRNPPMAGFNMRQEVQHLAEAGNPHGWHGWLEKFQQRARKVAGSAPVPVVEYLTLEQFIEADINPTAGASSLGKVHFEWQEKEEKFKARKNYLLDLYTPAELYNLVVQNAHQQTNSAFIKPELGKMRIAVTGDVYSYYLQAWLNYLTGAVYKDWSGSTMDEDVIRQQDRMLETLRRLADRHSLPFDFQGFDHQPSTLEIRILLEEFLGLGRHNVPTDEEMEWERLKDMCIDAFDDSVIYFYEDGAKVVFRVTGGVESGIRLTSLLGTYWNTVVSDIIAELVTLLTNFPTSQYIRGDDSAIFCQDYWSCLLFRIGYASVNAIGHDSKYGIHYQETEFLRVWYTHERAQGYVARAIPGIVQRKPWSSEPWVEEGQVTGALESIAIIERRLSGAESGIATVKQLVIKEWTRYRRTTADWLGCPRVYGGLGVLPWNGKVPTVPFGAIKPRARDYGLHFQVGPDTYQRYLARFEQFALTETEAREIQQNVMFTKARTDDVKQLATLFRENTRPPEAEWQDVGVLLAPVPLWHLAKYSDIRDMDTVDSGMYGCDADKKRLWDQIKEVATVRKIRPIEYMRIHHPAFVGRLRDLERKGMHRANALAYLFGESMSGNVAPLHPMLTRIVDKVVASVVTKQAGRRNINFSLCDTSAQASKTLLQSPLSKMLFSW